jgi:hypothetical protein
MKGIQGLIIAIGLGIVGALFNFAYLYNRSQETENEEFIGIAPNVTVARGDVLKEEHLVKVSIPRNVAGRLKDFAFPWAGQSGEIGMRVVRPVSGGSILLRDDMKTPAQTLAFSANAKPGIVETALGVPIDPRRGVVSLVEPGDMVMFIVPAGSAYESPTPAASTDDSARSDAAPAAPGKPDPAAASRLKPIPASGAAAKFPTSGATTLLGPFKVLSVGNRLGSTEVMRANRIPQSQENVLNVLVHMEKDKDNRLKFEPEAEKLERVLEESGNRPLTFLPLSRPQKAE